MLCSISAMNGGEPTYQNGWHAGLMKMGNFVISEIKKIQVQLPLYSSEKLDPLIEQIENIINESAPAHEDGDAEMKEEPKEETATQQDEKPPQQQQQEQAQGEQQEQPAAAEEKMEEEQPRQPTPEEEEARRQKEEEVRKAKEAYDEWEKNRLAELRKREALIEEQMELHRTIGRSERELEKWKSLMKRYKKDKINMQAKRDAAAEEIERLTKKVKELDEKYEEREKELTEAHDGQLEQMNRIMEEMWNNIFKDTTDRHIDSICIQDDDALNLELGESRKCLYKVREFIN